MSNYIVVSRMLGALLMGATIVTTLEAQAPSDSAAAQLPSVQLPPDLARVLTDYETEWRKGGAAVAQLFTEDGFVLSGGRPPIRGRAAIAAHYGSGGGGPLSLRALAYAAEGSVGYIIGGYTMERGTPDIGKFTLTLRKQNGRWMIVSDMDSPNRRPQQRSP